MARAVADAGRDGTTSECASKSDTVSFPWMLYRTGELQLCGLMGILIGSP